MFGSIGMPELILIFVVALLVFAYLVYALFRGERL